MSCGNCGRQNPPGALYCLDCGQKLRDPVLAIPVAVAALSPAQPGPFAMASNNPPVIASSGSGACPRCSVDNPPGIRYCRMCGLALAVDPNRPAPPPKAGGKPCARCGNAIDPGAAFCGVCGFNPSDSVQGMPQTTPHINVSVLAPAAPPANEAPPAAQVRTDNFGASPAQSLPQLVTILKDGSEGPAYRLVNAVTDIGRYEGVITLPDDPYLSPRHARIMRRNDRHWLRDLGSVNGIFYRIREPVELHHGDVVLVGQQVLRVEILSDGEISLGPVSHYGVMVFGTPEQPRLARLVQLTSEGIPRDVVHLYRDETVIGRESGDVVFTDDVFLSRRHAAVRLDRAQRRVVIRDLGSSNGTLVLFRGEREIVDGDLFRIGHHLFRFDTAGRVPGPGANGGNDSQGSAPR